MSTPEPGIAPAADYGWIRPRWFLAGFVLGTALLGAAGWKVSRTDIHPGFVRFHSMISPEGSYYPTLDEMESIVRARCRPDQVLVIVGGNSVLLGVWQRDVDIWSSRLQQILGDRFCVVNFAFRGAAPTEGGAVLAEALRGEYPRQILIANDAVLTGIEPLPSGPYRYIFWQAYFAGKLIKDPAREEQVRKYRGTGAAQRDELVEDRVSAWFNALLHYRDLWNWVSLRVVGSVPSYKDEYFPLYLKPHGAYPDPEVDGSDPKYEDLHYPDSTIEVEMKIVSGPRLFYSKGPDGRWTLADATRRDLAARFGEAMPRELRARTLMLVSGSSPYYLRRLSADEDAMVLQASRDSVSLFREAGYAAIDYGRDFEPSDFGDRTHMTKLGGWKLAALVAPEVEKMSQTLGYIR